MRNRVVRRGHVVMLNLHRGLVHVMVLHLHRGLVRVMHGGLRGHGHGSTDHVESLSDELF